MSRTHIPPAARRAKPKPGLRWVTPALSAVGGVLLGFILGRFGLKSVSFKYSTHFDVVDILGLLVTLAVALYLQHWVAQQSEIVKSHRSYLVELAHHVRESLGALHEDMRKKTKELEAITSGVHNLNTATAQLREAASICSVMTDLDALEREVKNYRQALTMGSFPYVDLTPMERSKLESIHAKCLSEITRFIVGVYQA